MKNKAVLFETVIETSSRPTYLVLYAVAELRGRDVRGRPPDPDAAPDVDVPQEAGRRQRANRPRPGLRTSSVGRRPPQQRRADRVTGLAAAFPRAVVRRGAAGPHEPHAEPLVHVHRPAAGVLHVPVMEERVHAQRAARAVVGHAVLDRDDGPTADAARVDGGTERRAAVVRRPVRTDATVRGRRADRDQTESLRTRTRALGSFHAGTTVRANDISHKHDKIFKDSVH